MGEQFEHIIQDDLRLFLVLMAIIMVFLCLASSNPQGGGDFPPDHYEDIECFGNFETCVKNCSCPTGLGDEQLCRESCDDEDGEDCWTWDPAWKTLDPLPR